MWLVALALTAAQAGADTGAPSARVKALLQNCDAHKFETTIDVTVDGKPKKSRVKLCGTEGQSDGDWLLTLRDAAAKTKANAAMPAAVRNQILAALNLEILRLTSGTLTASGRSDSALEGISPLPPIPDGPGPSTQPGLPPPRPIERSAPLEAYATLPPLPTTAPSPVHVLASGASPSIPVLAAPKMSFSCYVPGEADGPCTDFGRDTMLTVSAKEDLPSGTSLRFVRNGEKSADVEVAQLKRGKSERFALPAEVCRGVNGGKLEIRIVRSAPGAGPDGQEVSSDGPYVLHC